MNTETQAPHRTDWFARAKWGIFNHDLFSEQSPGKDTTTAEEWNRQVDTFDVKALASQVASTGAGYYFITLGQGSGHYCAPNATYDRYVGITPSKCSRRDLISDLYDALQPHGIALMAYVPADGSWADPLARKGLKMTEERRKGAGLNGTKLRQSWDGFSPSSSRGGFQENLPADGAHFANDGFEFPVVDDGLLKEAGLFLRDGQGDRLGVYFGRPFPVSRVVRGHAAVGQPPQGADFFFESKVAAFQFPTRCGL